MSRQGLDSQWEQPDGLMDERDFNELHQVYRHHLAFV